MLKRFSMITLLITLFFSISSTWATVSTKGVKKDLFDTLIMGNYKSGMRVLCSNDQKCMVSLSQIRCTLDIANGEMSEEGSCTFKNRKGDFGVLYNKDAFKLALQLSLYGSNYKANGTEVKFFVRTAHCSGQKNRQGQFVKLCQVQN